MKLAKIIFATSIVALLGAGCAKTPTKTPPTVGTSSAAPASGTATVKIMPDNTFEPTALFVKKGTTITFINNSSKPHGISPLTDAGKSLAGLDSKTAIPAGGKFTVTVNQTGRWLYADSANAAFGGVIDVTE